MLGRDRALPPLPHRPRSVADRLTSDVIQLAQQHGMNTAALKREDGYAEFINTVIFNPNYAMRENAYINDGNEF